MRRLPSTFGISPATAKARDRLEVEQDLAPLPAAQQLLEQDRNGEHHQPERIGVSEGRDKRIDIEAAVQPDQSAERHGASDQRNEPTDSGAI